MTPPQQPQQTQHHDRASALQQLPPQAHQHADALAAAGFNWAQILAILQAILGGLGPLVGPKSQPQQQHP